MQLLYGFVIPAAVAGIVLTATRRALPESLSRRYSASVATLAGFMTGYALLTAFASLADWTPESHWHWLPYLVLVAGLVGPVAQGLHPVERALLYSVLALAASWFLVPTWDDLEPSRWSYVVGFTACYVLLASLLEPLAARLHGPLLPALMCVCLTTAALILALAGNLRFAQVAGCGAGAWLGPALVACFQRRHSLMTGSAAVFSMLIVGVLMVGYVNSFSDVPWASYALIPTAPLALWLGAGGLIASRGRLIQAAVLLPLCLAPLLLAITLAFLAEYGGATGR